MDPKDKITDLGERIHRLTMMDELDRQKAKAERAMRTAEKRETGTERKAITVRREGDVYVLAENVTDAIKWHSMVSDGVVHKSSGRYLVRLRTAAAKGYKIKKE